MPTQASQNQQQTPAQPNQQPVASSTVVPNGLQATDSRENSPLPPQQVTQPPPVPPRDALGKIYDLKIKELSIFVHVL